ncbi:MAG: DinB family protein [Bacteroidota bacterium]
MSLPQHPHLATLARMHDATGADAHALLDAYTDAQRCWKPNAKSWSIDQCFEHLAITGEIYASAVDAALDGHAATANPAPYKPTWFGKLFLNFVKPEARMKVKTLSVFEPAAASSVSTDALSRFWTQHERIGQYLHRADGLPLNSIRIVSPASSLVKFTLGEVMTLLVWHEKRHVRQAQRLIAHTQFPHEAA